jgi:Carboxypeptidase regulatory-like domain
MKSLAKVLTHTLRKSNVPMLAMALMLGMALCCTHTLAQSGAGTIQGTVTDSTGAVIPGASVHVVNQSTGVATDARSNDVGYYQVPDLFTGTYVLTISAPSMKTYKTTVELQASQNAVINPALTPGAVTQQVEVAADVIQLTTTDSGSVTSTLENSRINQLPMNTRQLVTLVGETTAGLEGGGTRANGLMGQAMEYVADGAPMDNRNFGNVGNGMAEAALPDPDSVQEVHVEMSGESAEYATPATAVLTTKSGTNSVHGSFFETARNNAVGIARNRQTLFATPDPHLVRNEFGLSAGGPIILPHVYHGKDKSFWFFAYERYSLAQNSPENTTVPTYGMRGLSYNGGSTPGNLANADYGSGLVNEVFSPSGVPQQLYNPATTAASASCNGSGTANSYCRAPFGNGIAGDPGNNQIPMSMLSPATKLLYSIIPLPTNPNTNPTQAFNTNVPNLTFVVVPNISFRLDHTFTEANKAYLRYSQGIQQSTQLMNFPASAPATIAANGFPAGAEGLSAIPTATFSFAVGYTHVFSPTFYAETILSNQWQNENEEAGGNPGLDYESMLGTPNNLGEPGFPLIGLNNGNSGSLPFQSTGTSMLLMGMRGTMFNYEISQIISNLDENLSKTVGRHQFMFGGRYRHERFGYLTDRNPDQILFDSNATALENPGSKTSYTATPNTGYPDADFFLGAPHEYIDYLQGPYGHFHDMEFDTYFQDNFHLSKSLTVNLGLRYEAHPAAWTKDGLMEGTDLKNHALVLENPPSSYVPGGFTTQGVLTNLANLGVKFETPAQAGFPTAMMRSYDLNFSPRIGLAYQPFGSRLGTVLRGAYGRFTYPVPLRGSLKNGVKSIPFQVPFAEDYNAGNYTDGNPNFLLRSTPSQTSTMGLNSSGVVNSNSTTAVAPPLTPYSNDPSAFPPEFVTQMNFTIEQPIKGNSALRVSYLWTHGTNLDQYFYPNYTLSTYAYEMLNGATIPADTPAQPYINATAAGPWDSAIYGKNVFDTRSGFSNDYALEVNYQRLFHHGVAYQIMYTRSNPFRVGGNYSNDSTFYPAASYVTCNPCTNGGAMTPDGAGATIGPMVAPPAPPAGLPDYNTGVGLGQNASLPTMGWRALNKYENYIVDNQIPKTHIQFNGIVDLPFGRGKRFLGNANRFVDELVGGFQIAGDGSVVSQDFQVSNANWGPTNPLHVYKHGAKFTDCRSATCHPAYLWFNGYLSPKVQGLVSGSPATVSGLPTNYQPYQVPIDNSNMTPALDKYVGTNEVTITNSATGQLVATGASFAPGSGGGAVNPFYHSFLNGPNNWTSDLSIFKVFPITERVNVRFNMDAFNAFNVQGYTDPSGTDGTEQFVAGVGQANSYWTPRQVQFTMRLSF